MIDPYKSSLHELQHVDQKQNLKEQKPMTHTTQDNTRTTAQLWSRLEKLDEKLAELQDERNQIVATLQARLEEK